MTSRMFHFFMCVVVVFSMITVSSYSDAIDPNVAEMQGIEIEGEPLDFHPGDPAARALALEKLLTIGLLLVPDSTNDRVMAFDPVTGNLVDADFIPTDPTNLSTPIHAMISAGGNSILVSDQAEDVVQEYDLSGVYLGVFAPAGGPNTAILDNIRGMSMRPNGNLLVTVGGGANDNAIAEFDIAGNFVGNFVANGAGGLDSPFGIILRADQNDYLVGGITSDAIHRYDMTGTAIANFSDIDSFPEQLLQITNGNILVGNFTGTQEGVVEYQSDGTLVGVYDPASIGYNRGVYELPSGNILTTNSSGVYEIDRTGALIETKISGVSARFIQYISTLADVGDYVWHDQNANGIQDMSEPGGPNITVNLLDGSGGFLMSTLTDASGLYSFTDLAPGMYMVEFVAPPDAVFSPANQGGDDTIDSDADPVTGRTGIFTLINGLINNSFDCGLYADPLAVELVYFLGAFTQGNVVLAWQTASEIDVLGFNIYRTELSPSVFPQKTIKINDSLIISQGSAISGADYEYFDMVVESGTHYRYILQSVELSGVVTNDATTDVSTSRSVIKKQLMSISE